MPLVTRTGLVLASLAVLVSACAAPSPAPGTGATAPQEPARTTPKRIVAAIPSAPPVVSATVLAHMGITPQGGEAIDTLLTSGLQNVDHTGTPRPQLAEQVSTIENGLWRLLPDGRMELTWKIKPNATWHDGAPFTADDISFTWTLTQDRDLPAWRHVASTYDAIERVEAPDPRTVVTYWKRTFIYANLAFGFATARPLFPVPRHLLERSYLTEKASFNDLPFWSTEYVGTGPFKLKEWALGTHAVVVANDAYVLGRPKIDEIEVRFIPDPNTMVANFLAGAVNVNFGVSLSPEQARQILDRVAGSRMDLAPTGVLTAYPQFINPDPRILSNVFFRRALVHGLDRQEMVETLMYGLSSIGHTFVNPSEADYPIVEPYIVKYEYDSRKAVQMIEGLGLTKGPDGFYRDAAGQPLTPLEIRVDGRGMREKASLAVADAWKRLGVNAVASTIPSQREADQEYMATYPGLEITRRGNFRWSLGRVLNSFESPLPENRWAGGNRGRYQNPEMDRLIELHDRTIAFEERARVLGEMIRIVSDEVVLMGLFYDLDPTVYTGNLINVHGKYERSTQAWNAHEWELR